jgi:flagellar hook-basal body complex protein FliE
MKLEEAGSAHADAIHGFDERVRIPIASTQHNNTFSEALGRAAEAVMEPQRAAAEATEMFARGEEGEIHQSMLAMERADISLRFLVSVRNKALEAYREIMHMGG